MHYIQVLPTGISYTCVVCMCAACMCVYVCAKIPGQKCVGDGWRGWKRDSERYVHASWMVKHASCNMYNQLTQEDLSEEKIYSNIYFTL